MSSTVFIKKYINKITGNNFLVGSGAFWLTVRHLICWEFRSKTFNGQPNPDPIQRLDIKGFGHELSTYQVAAHFETLDERVLMAPLNSYEQFLRHLTFPCRTVHRHQLLLNQLCTRHDGCFQLTFCSVPCILPVRSLAQKHFALSHSSRQPTPTPLALQKVRWSDENRQTGPQWARIYIHPHIIFGWVANTALLGQ